MTIYIYVKDGRAFRTNSKPSLYPHVRISSKGNVVTIFDGKSKRTISFDNFVKAYGDFRKANIEYKTYIYMVFDTLALHDESYGKLRDAVLEVLREKEALDLSLIHI